MPSCCMYCMNIMAPWASGDPGTILLTSSRRSLALTVCDGDLGVSSCAWEESLVGSLGSGGTSAGEGASRSKADPSPVSASTTASGRECGGGCSGLFGRFSLLSLLRPGREIN